MSPFIIQIVAFQKIGAHWVCLYGKNWTISQKYSYIYHEFNMRMNNNSHKKYENSALRGSKYNWHGKSSSCNSGLSRGQEQEQEQEHHTLVELK